MIHFILTRFNLKLWPRDKKGARIDREAWIVERMGLFEKYCYPSIKRQSCKEFRWVLLLDDSTPEKIVERLDKLREECPQMELCKVPVQYSQHFAELFQKYVQRGMGEADKVLTTYLDNDDALSVDYVERVQAAAAKCQGRTVLTFAEGCQYFTGMRIATRVSYPNNHFITLVEDAKNARTVYGLGSHYFLKAGFDLKITQLEGLCWTEVIHSDNVDNDVKMTLRTHLFKDARAFRAAFGEGFEFASAARNVFIFKWFPQACGQLIRRIGYKIKPRDWWGN